MIEKIVGFLKLIRWFHEVVVIVPFVGLFIVIDSFAKQNGVICQMSGIDFLILCFCVQLLIATGCVLNDIADRKIDKINKPKTHIVDNVISLKSTWIIFFVFTSLIVLTSAYISLFVFTEWIYISIIVYILSISYDFYFKRTPLLGNILMALLTAFIPLVLFFFAEDCIKNINNEKVEILIYLYASLPFLIIIPRELSLDISDIEGDRINGCRTLPAIIGEKKSKTVVVLFLILIILLSIPMAFLYHYLSFSMITIDILLAIYIYKLRKVKSRIEYIKIGRFLWFVMILGLILFTVSTMW